MMVTVTAMLPAEKDAFAGIWLPWLRDSMGRQPEPEDLIIIADPARYYRGTGAEAFLAWRDGKVVGAVAIKKLGTSGYELCKLVVAEVARGHGIGGRLVEACLSFAAERDGRALYLQSFRALDVALALYRRMGFRHVPPPPQMAVLARTEIVMVRAVGRASSVRRRERAGPRGQ